MITTVLVCPQGAEAGLGVTTTLMEGLSMFTRQIVKSFRRVGIFLSDEAKVNQMVDRAVQEFGRLDAAFNNAGVMAQVAKVADSSREDWDRVIGTNLRGVWTCMKYELRQMERQGGGAIVNNGSVGAMTGHPGVAPYIASKHGIVGLTRTAALEYAKCSIRVNAVNPFRSAVLVNQKKSPRLCFGCAVRLPALSLGTRSWRMVEQLCCRKIFRTHSQRAP